MHHLDKYVVTSVVNTCREYYSWFWNSYTGEKVLPKGPMGLCAVRRSCWHVSFHCCWLLTMPLRATVRCLLHRLQDSREADRCVIGQAGRKAKHIEVKTLTINVFQQVHFMISVIYFYVNIHRQFTLYGKLILHPKTLYTVSAITSIHLLSYQICTVMMLWGLLVHISSKHWEKGGNAPYNLSQITWLDKICLC